MKEKKILLGRCMIYHVKYWKYFFSGFSMHQNYMVRFLDTDCWVPSLEYLIPYVHGGVQPVHLAPGDVVEEQISKINTLNDWTHISLEKNLVLNL
jgi:hypothetical protein